MAETTAIAISVPAEAIVNEIEALGVTHVVNVPDTHQKTVLAAVMAGLLFRRFDVACANQQDAIARHRLEAGHGVREPLPALSGQRADAHAVEKTGHRRFRRGRLAMRVEPDDGGVAAAAAADSGQGEAGVGSPPPNPPP